MSCTSSAGSATGHGCSQSRSCAERLPQLLRDMRRLRLEQRDGGLGGEARAGRGGSSASSLTSSITAEIGVWNCMRRPTSSVTLRDRLVRLARRAARRPASPAGACSATSCDERARAGARSATMPSIPAVGPLHVLVGGAHEQDVEAHRRRRRTRRRARPGRRRCPSTSTSSCRPSSPSPGGTARANGSRKPSRPISFITFTKKRE